MLEKEGKHLTTRELHQAIRMSKNPPNEIGLICLQKSCHDQKEKRPCTSTASTKGYSSFVIERPKDELEHGTVLIES
jgi:hypothetical protein